MRAKCKRNNRQSGGGPGGGWGYTTPDSLGPVVSNSLVADKIGNCRAAASPRPGFIENGYQMLRGGLPGMRGGRRRTQRKQRNRKQRVQSGGRYGFVDPSSAAAFGGTPYTSGIAPMSQIPCEASRSQIPPSGAAGALNLPVKISPLGQSGGGGLGGASLAETVPTARYETSMANPIQTAAGTLVETRVPISSLSVNMPTYQNPACVKTGGGSRKGRKSRKQKKQRSQRKRTQRKRA